MRQWVKCMFYFKRTFKRKEVPQKALLEKALTVSRSTTSLNRSPSSGGGLLIGGTITNTGYWINLSKSPKLISSQRIELWQLQGSWRPAKWSLSSWVATDFLSLFIINTQWAVLRDQRRFSWDEHTLLLYCYGFFDTNHQNLILWLKIFEIYLIKFIHAILIWCCSLPLYSRVFKEFRYNSFDLSEKWFYGFGMQIIDWSMVTIWILFFNIKIRNRIQQTTSLCENGNVKRDVSVLWFPSSNKKFCFVRIYQTTEV